MNKWILRAVMFTDIIGYTDLTGSDRSRADQIVTKNYEIHVRLVRKYGGRIINSWGDGTLASFPSTINAVRCSMAIQKKIRTAGYKLRIGMDLGDVRPRSKNLVGNCINIASRIEKLGVGQSVLFSSRVRDQVYGVAGIVLHSIGPVKLKGVDDIQDLYCIVNDNLQIPIIPSSSLPLVSQPLSTDELKILKYLNNPITQELHGASDLELSSIVVNMQNRIEAVESLSDRGFVKKAPRGYGITREGSNYLRRS